MLQMSFNAGAGPVGRVWRRLGTRQHVLVMSPEICVGLINMSLGTYQYGLAMSLEISIEMITLVHLKAL